ncbi:unnamed protein product, partial [Rotaria magnacalcarata]
SRRDCANSFLLLEIHFHYFSFALLFIYVKQGQTSSSGTRCFISNENEAMKFRNNATYDKFMRVLATNYVAKDPMQDKACGHLGYCALRELTYFEIGESFCFDSLHGLYAGAFASNCVPVVHSLAHIHQTLWKFGPLHNYSTFNFESTIGEHA